MKEVAGVTLLIIGVLGLWVGLAVLTLFLANLMLGGGIAYSFFNIAAMTIFIMLLKALK